MRANDDHYRYLALDLTPGGTSVLEVCRRIHFNTDPDPLQFQRQHVDTLLIHNYCV